MHAISSVIVRSCDTVALLRLGELPHELLDTETVRRVSRSTPCCACRCNRPGARLEFGARDRATDRDEMSIVVGLVRRRRDVSDVGVGQAVRVRGRGPSVGEPRVVADAYRRAARACRNPRDVEGANADVGCVVRVCGRESARRSGATSLPSQSVLSSGAEIRVDRAGAGDRSAEQAVARGDARHRAAAAARERRRCPDRARPFEDLPARRAALLNVGERVRVCSRSASVRQP